MKTETFICSNCRGEHTLYERVVFEDRELCPYCLAQTTAICRCCGQRFRAEDNYGSADTPICPACYDRYYTTCHHCSGTILQSDAFYEDNDEEQEYPYCRECYLQYVSRNSIHDYYYKPAPVFFGEGGRWFGLELEVDDAGESSSNAGQVLDIANASGEERLYCKHDGSLNDGFELVTHPMTLAYHLDEMPSSAELMNWSFMTRSIS